MKTQKPGNFVVLASSQFADYKNNEEFRSFNQITYLKLERNSSGTFNFPDGSFTSKAPPPNNLPAANSELLCLAEFLVLSSVLISSSVSE